jgi:WD40 repeat protein
MTRLWSVADPARPVPLGRPLTGPASYAISVAFSPHGGVLAIGSADKTVRLWSVANPARPRPLGSPLTGPTSYVYSVAFSPDGHTLAAGVTDGTVRLWDTSPTAAAAAVCANVGQPLTQLEWQTYAPGLAYRAPCS